MMGFYILCGAALAVIIMAVLPQKSWDWIDKHDKVLWK
jgi:hypothetical protein